MQPLGALGPRGVGPARPGSRCGGCHTCCLAGQGTGAALAPVELKFAIQGLRSCRSGSPREEQDLGSGTHMAGAPLEPAGSLWGQSAVGAGVELGLLLGQGPRLHSTQARRGCWLDPSPSPLLSSEKDIELEPVSAVQLLCRVTNRPEALARGSAAHARSSRDLGRCWAPVAHVAAEASADCPRLPSLAPDPTLPHAPQVQSGRQPQGVGRSDCSPRSCGRPTAQRSHSFLRLTVFPRWPHCAPGWVTMCGPEASPFSSLSLVHVGSGACGQSAQRRRGHCGPRAGGRRQVTHAQDPRRSSKLWAPSTVSWGVTISFQQLGRVGDPLWPLGALPGTAGQGCPGHLRSDGCGSEGDAFSAQWLCSRAPRRCPLILAHPDSGFVGGPRRWFWARGGGGGGGGYELWRCPAAGPSSGLTLGCGSGAVLCSWGLSSLLAGAWVFAEAAQSVPSPLPSAVAGQEDALLGVQGGAGHPDTVPGPGCGCFSTACVHEAHVDQKNKVVTTPAFMCDTALHHIHDGIGAMVRKVLELAGR